LRDLHLKNPLNAQPYFLAYSIARLPLRQPDIDSKFNLTPYVTANDTIPRKIDIRGRILPRRADTVLLGGSDVLYYRELALERSVRRKEAIFSLLASVRLHYRMNDRFEFSAGFFHRPTITTENRTDDFTGFPDDAYYFASVSKNIYGGLATDFNYHLRKGKRLRPYLGMKARFGLSHSEFLGSRKLFPGLNQEEPELVNNVIERFRKNTILDFDLDLLAGLNYQISDRLMIGIEGHLNRFLIPFPAALQVRYRLKGKGTPAE